MNSFKRTCGFALLIAAPLPAQTTVAPPPNAGSTGTVAPATLNLTDAEQAMLKKCKAMAPQQQAQSSKCSKVLIRAGQEDPAKAIMRPSGN
jgi:hypothetical protein